MKDMSLHLSEGDLHDYEPPIYCRDCKHYDSVYNDCLKYDIEEVIKPDKPLEFCAEYEERENEINITDMIKALRCVASQDSAGDCYCDHFNAHLTCEQFGDNARLDEKHMSCGGNLKDTQNCPYHQNTYGVCFEDGELFWLKDVVDMLEEIQQYRAIGTVEEVKNAYGRGYNQGGIDRAEELQKCREYGYKKAIDEFAERLHTLEFDNAYGVNVVLTPKEIDEIAEQMKGGAE